MCQVHVEESEMITLEPRSDWMERVNNMTTFIKTELILGFRFY